MVERYKLEVNVRFKQKYDKDEMFLWKGYSNGVGGEGKIMWTECNSTIFSCEYATLKESLFVRPAFFLMSRFRAKMSLRGSSPGAYGS